MQVLHELLHSLTKDEKRLYNQHRRNGRFQKIYEVYLANPVYDKQIDKDLYDKEFADVSKPFYSMQKRSLFDDVVTVLLSYSNLQLPQYKLPRALAKAQVLLERNAPAAALFYLEEARQNTSDETDPVTLLSLVHAEKAAQEKLGESKFSTYRHLFEEEKALVARLGTRSDLSSIRQALLLLQRNADNFTEDVLAQNAEELLRLAQDADSDPSGKDHFFERLEIELLYHEITGQLEKFHRELVYRYKQVEREQDEAPGPSYYRMLNLVLQSALRVGDFLLLSGLTYKTTKQLEYEPGTMPEIFLADYLEVAALYHFYENEIPQALRELEDLFQVANLPEDQAERCAYYYLAMLVAAHLPQHGVENLDRLSKRFDFLSQLPLTQIFRVILGVDMHQSSNELSLHIERVKKDLRKDPATKPFIDALVATQAYLEHKPVKLKPYYLFPTDWEPVMRVDFWLQAKLENKFYYNLIADYWQERKKVFS